MRDGGHRGPSAPLRIRLGLLLTLACIGCNGVTVVRTRPGAPPADSCASEPRTAASEPPALRGDAEFDVVVYGATGLTGGLAAHYLATRPGVFSFALAGRSLPKLEAFAAGLARLGVPRLPSANVVAAADDLASLRSLARRARVIISAAGPYKLLAPLLVKACVEEGTHLVTVSGETLFIRDMIDAYHATADRKGVKIVNAAGIVSVPIDLGAVLALDALEAEVRRRGRRRGRVDLKGYLTEMHTQVLPESTPCASEISGYLNIMDGKNRSELISDAYQLAPGAKCRLDHGRSDWPHEGFAYDANVGEPAAASAQFGRVNAPVVRSTLELLGHRNVSYVEGATRSGLGMDGWRPAEAKSATSGYCDLGVCTRVPEAAQRQGSFKALVVAEESGVVDGVRAAVNYTGLEEPDFKQTAKLFAEVGLCLADAACHHRAVRGGVLTPASAVDAATFVGALQAARTDEGEPLVTISVAVDG